MFFLLSTEGITNLDNPRIDPRILGAAAAIREMMVPILQLARASMRLKDLYPGPDFKSKVEGCAVEYRDVAR
jgi:hypothetical protein